MDTPKNTLPLRFFFLLLWVALSLFLVCCAQQKKMPRVDSGFAYAPFKTCQTDLKYLNQVTGWQTNWPRQWQQVVLAEPADTAKAIEYWSAAPRQITQLIQQLRDGIQNQQTAPRVVVTRIQQQVKALQASLFSANSHYIFNGAVQGNALLWNRLLRENIAPALAEFEAFLTQEYLPNAQQLPGISYVPNGRACFFNAVRWWTSLDISQQSIEQLGWQYINQTRAALLTTGKQGESLQEIFEALKHSANREHTSAAELIRVSEQAIKRAQEKTLLMFSQASPQGIGVRELPLYMQASFPAGFYEGNPKPNALAHYVINPSRPSERRLMAEVIAFHEAIPGHHLWNTYPRHAKLEHYASGKWGLLEGWAIYAEYLADEMGLYSSDFDRQGMMAKHLWAASRLIVEPGLHLNGWSRKQAIDFMLDNTLLSRSEIELEVDRYIAMPGHSLTYILGANVILQERARAKQNLGADFVIKAFHDAVLAKGPRPLSRVKHDIRAWVNTQRAKG